MKTCHVTSAHSRGDVRIFEKECTSLAQSGFNVTLIVSDDKKEEIRNGVKIVSTGFKPPSRWQRMLFSRKYIWEKIQGESVDLCHFHDPELLPYALKLKKRGKKVIFDSHEDVPAQILDKVVLFIF